MLEARSRPLPDRQIRLASDAKSNAICATTTKTAPQPAARPAGAPPKARSARPMHGPNLRQYVSPDPSDGTISRPSHQMRRRKTNAVDLTHWSLYKIMPTAQIITPTREGRLEVGNAKGRRGKERAPQSEVD